MAGEITETDELLTQVCALIVSMMSLDDPRRQQGFDNGLAHIRDQFLRKDKQKAAAVVDTIRLKTAENWGDSIFMNLLRKPG